VLCRRRTAVRAIAPSIPAHAFPPAGPPDALVKAFCRRRRAVETRVIGGAPGAMVRPQLELAEGPTCHITDKAVSIYFAPLNTCRAGPPQAHAEPLSHPFSPACFLPPGLRSFTAP
jgi:hypothetical protein